MKKVYDLSLTGTVVEHSQSDDGMFVFEVLVTCAVLHNQAATRTFRRPSIVRIKVHPGNLVANQLDLLKKKGAEATFNYTIRPEILVEDVLCGTQRPVREQEEFISTIYGGR